MSDNETNDIDIIERIPIPEDIALRHSRSEILEYAREKNSTVRLVCDLFPHTQGLDTEKDVVFFQKI